MIHNQSLLHVLILFAFYMKEETISFEFHQNHIPLFRLHEIAIIPITVPISTNNKHSKHLIVSYRQLSFHHCNRYYAVRLPLVDGDITSNHRNCSSTSDTTTNYTTIIQNTTNSTSSSQQESIAGTNNNATITTSNSSCSNVEQIRIQAQQLREETIQMRQAIDNAAKDKELKRITKVDNWTEHLLIYQKIGIVEQLNTVQQVVTILINERYSPEQVYQIFDRLCVTTSINGRDSIQTNQLLQLLLNYVNKMDEIERCDNDNKRWSQIVERTLNKRLFAMEWNINLDGDGD
jgi:hypothetical protein